MFNLNGSKSVYNKGEIKSITINESTVTISFQEGFAAGESFVAVGYDHVELSGTDRDTFLTAFTSDNSLITAETFVQAARGPVVVAEVPQEEI